MGDRVLPGDVRRRVAESARSSARAEHQEGIVASGDERPARRVPA